MNSLLEAVLDWPNLSLAWEMVAQNHGAPGADGVRISRFRRHWQEHLYKLRDLVRAGRYRPGRLRRIVIPKKKGGWRVLKIPNVGDRVLQRAVLNVLEPRYEQVFLPCSFGYRPGRSLHDAVAALLQHRDAGRVWVLDADIDNCFDELNHLYLRTQLMNVVTDPRLMDLMLLWLKAGRFARKPDRGIAQGMPISPLWANVYLHQLDMRLTAAGLALVRYADDFVVLCDSRKQAERVYALVADVLAEMHLRYEPTKTRVTSFHDGFEFLGVAFRGATYTFTWEQKRVKVAGPTPAMLWNYVPHGYDSE